jgi:predicted nucleic acid-binding protein
VYAYDASEGEKHITSKNILRAIWEEGGGVVCLQNLMEFFAIITSKVEKPINIQTARSIIEDFIKSDSWMILDRDTDTFFNAINVVSLYDVHLWDAMIVACMMENEIKEIVTENKKDFEKIPGIRVTVPF